MKEEKCLKCGELMSEIGHIASIKIEGEPAEKWDGSFDFECRNQECENYAVVVNIKI